MTYRANFDDFSRRTPDEYTPRFGISMKVRIIGLAMGCMLAGIISVGILGFYQGRAISLDNAREKLVLNAERSSLVFEFIYASVVEDLKLMITTPSIPGIIEALHGSDGERDDASFERWEKRLLIVFDAFLDRRSSYYQMRFVEFENGGQELVRRDREQHGNVSAGPGIHRQLSDELYFKRVLAAPVGQPVFSDLRYSEAFGSVDPGPIPTLWAMISVADADGKKFGFIVVNIDFESLMTKFYEEIPNQNDAVFVTSSGNFLIHSEYDNGQTNNLQMDGNYTIPVPEMIQNVLDSDRTEGFYETPREVGYLVQQKGFYDQGSPDMSMLLKVQKKDFYLQADQYRDATLVLAAFILIILSIIAFTVATFTVRPILTLVYALKFSRNEDLLKRLPTQRKDEIGKLARALSERTQALEEEKFYSNIVNENVIDGLLLWNQTGKIRSFNSSCERIFGYTKAEIVGTNIAGIIPSLSILRKPNSGGDPSFENETTETEGRTKSGNTVPIEIAANEVRIDGRVHYSGVIRDIRQRLEVERIKADFVASVSHELRTPLTSVHGSLALAVEFLPDDTHETASKMIAMARKNTERLIVLVNEILDFEKINDSNIEYNIEKIDIKQALDQSISLNSGFAIEHRAHLELIAEDEGLYSDLDSDRFHQVLTNLISNAVKFSPENGVVTLKAERSGEGIKVSITDRGPGIPLDFRKRIFEPFTQSSQVPNQKSPGTGLGLAITQRLVVGMGGEIGFDSVEGKGTTFWVEFPCTQE